ncbi:unnamed protein product [Chrysoparadoxa australica]
MGGGALEVASLPPKDLYWGGSSTRRLFSAPPPDEGELKGGTQPSLSHTPHTLEDGATVMVLKGLAILAAGGRGIQAAATLQRAMSSCAAPPVWLCGYRGEGSRNLLLALAFAQGGSLARATNHLSAALSQLLPKCQDQERQRLCGALLFLRGLMRQSQSAAAVPSPTAQQDFDAAARLCPALAEPAQQASRSQLKVTLTLTLTLTPHMAQPSPCVTSD